MTAQEIFRQAGAIIADIDGTLVDSTGPVRRAWAAFAARHGLGSDDVHTFAQGRPTRESIALLVPKADLAVETALVDRAELEDTEGIRALPGAAEVLAASVPVGIATSCSRALAICRLKAAGLPIPSVLVTADDVAHGKPGPACFVLAARLLDVDPSICVVLEDTPAGIAAGNAAGAKVIAVRTTHGDDELEHAAAVIDDLTAIRLP